MSSLLSAGRAPDPAAPAVVPVAERGDAPVDVDQPGELRARWVMRAPCAMSPGQLAGVLGSLAGVSLLIGGFFWWMGAPGVLPFACVEMLCLTAALLIYAGRATDGDVVEWIGPELQVRSTRQGRDTVVRLPAAWTRVRCAGSAGIELACDTQRVWVGRQVRPEQRLVLAGAMRAALLGAASDDRP